MSIHSDSIREKAYDQASNSNFLRVMSTTGLVLGLLALGVPASAAETSIKAATGHGPLGVGVMVGNPISVGGRYWLSPHVAAQVWLGSNAYRFGPRLSADLLFGAHGLVPALGPKVNVGMAIGGGMVVQGERGPSRYHCHDDPHRYCHFAPTHGTATLGLRLPLSFSVLIRKISLDVFAESAFTFDVLPYGYVSVEAGIGARYYF